MYALLDAWTVHVFLKDSIFEASSPTRHTTELARLMKKMFPDAVALIMYTDGGPDHNCKHTSVRCGLLALFLELDLDTMVVMRTAPTQSWANPVERIMSVLNLGLQGVALARDTMPDEYEKDFKKCHGMTDVRNAANAYEVELDPYAEDNDMLHEFLHRQHEEEEELMSLLSREEEESQLHQEEEEQRLQDEFQMELLLEDEQMEEQPVRHLVDKQQTVDQSKNPFVDAYMKSIKPARDIITSQWRNCVWDKKSLSIEQPASDKEVNAIPFHSYACLDICIDNGVIYQYAYIDDVFYRQCRWFVC